MLEHPRREKTGYLVSLPFTNSFILLRYPSLNKSQSNEKGHPKLLGGADHHNAGIQALLRAESWVEMVGWSVGSATVPLPFHLLPAVDSLGISDELKEKLEDVLIPEQQFTLGRMLGKGVGVVRD